MDKAIKVSSERPKCPRCGGKSVKNGTAVNKQRHKCKECKFQFTRLTPKGKPAWMKALALLLYVSGSSLNSIARNLDVSTPTVLEWVRNFAIANYEKPEPGSALIVELDEMWHFINGKKTKFGYGKLFAGIQADLLTGKLEIAALRPSKSC